MNPLEHFWCYKFTCSCCFCWTETTVALILCKSPYSPTESWEPCVQLLCIILVFWCQCLGGVTKKLKSNQPDKFLFCTFLGAVMHEARFINAARCWKRVSELQWPECNSSLVWLSASVLCHVAVSALCLDVVMWHTLWNKILFIRQNSCWITFLLHYGEQFYANPKPIKVKVCIDTWRRRRSWWVPVWWCGAPPWQQSPSSTRPCRL